MALLSKHLLAREFRRHYASKLLLSEVGFAVAPSTGVLRALLPGVLPVGVPVEISGPERVPLQARDRAGHELLRADLPAATMRSILPTPDQSNDSLLVGDVL